MSILFGMRQPDNMPMQRETLLALAEPTRSWAPDGTLAEIRKNVGFGVQPYLTHEREKQDSYPLGDPSGNLVALDGRLDNRETLRAALCIEEAMCSDSYLVLCAFEKWGSECFARFVGEWAIVIWSEEERALYLARDHAGTRSLYYEQSNGFLRWGTFLETLLFERDRDLEPEYLQRYLACLPLRELTPYRGVRGVRPAHFVRVSSNATVSARHWQSLTDATIHYKTDAEYEGHFRWLFLRAVERRTSKGASILAHLSGGMDSSSIVCMSDFIRRERGGARQLLDTLSYFDDEEPHWNERPYVTLIEQNRGKVGIHLTVSNTLRSLEPLDLRYTLPGPDGSTFERERSLIAALRGTDYRVIVSGAGGDECFGGIATGLPELADHLRRVDITALLRAGTKWALSLRQPLIQVLAEAARFARDAYCGRGEVESSSLPSWLRFTREEDARSDDPLPVHPRICHYRPSAIANAAMWEPLSESLPQTSRSLLRRFEYRYPCLDRDLVDFVFRIPREQLIQPGRRRSLMRRAMVGIVPKEVIERRRKAYIARGPLTWFERNHETIDALFSRSQLEGLGLIDGRTLRECLRVMVTQRDFCGLPAMNRAIALELWLQSRAVVAVPFSIAS